MKLLSFRFSFSLSANQFPTNAQPSSSSISLKMVNANPSKELQNVLPKCNPFPFHIEYHSYQGICIAPLPCYYGERAGVRGISPPHLNNLTAICCKCDKNGLVTTATLTTFSTFAATIAAAQPVTIAAAKSAEPSAETAKTGLLNLKNFPNHQTAPNR